MSVRPSAAATPKSAALSASTFVRRARPVGDIVLVPDMIEVDRLTAKMTDEVLKLEARVDRLKTDTRAAQDERARLVARVEALERAPQDNRARLVARVGELEQALGNDIGSMATRIGALEQALRMHVYGHE